MKNKKNFKDVVYNKYNKTLRIMKISTFLIFISAFNLLAESGYSQGKNISLKLANTYTIENVISEIEKTTDYVFIYNEDVVPTLKKEAKVEMTDQSLDEILNQLVKGTDLGYSLSAKQVTLYKDESKQVFAQVESSAPLVVQQPSGKTITGRVTDTSEEPLPGVTVVVKGTTKGTTTDVDGNFNLTSVPENATLQFSFVGMKMQEIPIGNQTRFDVVMEEEAIGLAEVVAIGYGTMRKSDLTGSVVSANIEAFRESPNLNIMQSLQGSVPGVQIGQVSTTGAEPSIQIRGVNTLGGNKSPLIVVDGIIYTAKIGDLNPSDIESVEVLKDASSKAIYGSQSANGVILITTISGDKSDKPTFAYSGSMSFQSPTINARPLNREETLNKIKGVYYDRAYLPPNYTEPNPEFNWRNDTELVPLAIEGIENGTDFDWYDELTSIGHIQNHLLSVNGGTEKTTYYISGGFTENVGFVINDEYKRYTTRINIKNDITNWLALGVNTYGSFTDFSGVGPGPFYATFPFSTPYKEDGSINIYPLGQATTFTNPLVNTLVDEKRAVNYISGVFFGDVKIPKINGLKYRINYNKSLSWREIFVGDRYGENNTGLIKKDYGTLSEATLDNILTYERQFKEHQINGTLLYGYRKADYNSTSASGSNIPNINLSYNSLQQALIQNISSSAWEEASLYQMLRLSYNYKNRYLFTGTLRRDGFSGFAKNNKFATFPSLGFAWVLSNEPFFNNSIINYLKLRASYGQNGNQTARYSSLARVSATDDFRYVYGDGASSSMGQALASLANDDLKWEKTSGMNNGIDFQMFDNRISGNIEYYRTTTTDLLWDMVIPDVTGFSSIKTNIGEVANSGFEFYIQTTPIRRSNFSWDFGVNFSTNKNKINKLLGYDHDGDGVEDDLIASGLFIGKSIGAIYGYEIDGIWQINDDIPEGYNPGNYRIVDQNDDGKITADDDRVFLGRTEPTFLAGIQNNLTYKNFTLRFFIHTVQGGKDGYLGGQFHGEHSKGNFAMKNFFNFFDHWSVTNPDAKYSVWYEAPQINPARYCSRSFVRLQDISLAYKVNHSIFQNIGLQGLKLYISGKNLLTFSNWDGWDPETNSGITGSYYPVMKSLTFGVDIKF